MEERHEHGERRVRVPDDDARRAAARVETRGREQGRRLRARGPLAVAHVAEEGQIPGARVVEGTESRDDTAPVAGELSADAGCDLGHGEAAAHRSSAGSLSRVPVPGLSTDPAASEASRAWSPEAPAWARRPRAPRLPATSRSAAR